MKCNFKSPKGLECLLKAHADYVYQTSCDGDDCIFMKPEAPDLYATDAMRVSGPTVEAMMADCEILKELVHVLDRHNEGSGNGMIDFLAIAEIAKKHLECDTKCGNCTYLFRGPECPVCGSKK